MRRPAVAQASCKGHGFSTARRKTPVVVAFPAGLGVHHVRCVATTARAENSYLGSDYADGIQRWRALEFIRNENA